MIESLIERIIESRARSRVESMVESILFLEIEFKQLNSISSWARVERNQLNLNSNSILNWVDLSQFNSILIQRQI